MKTIKIQNSFAKIMKVLWPDGSSFQVGNFKGKSLPRLIREGCALVALLLAFILLPSAVVQAQAFLEWAKQAGGSSGGDDAQGFGIAVDASGNSYVTGPFFGSATFGPGEANQTNLTSAGADDILVAKYNSSGEQAWAKKAGGSSSDAGRGIALDASGNSYVTGDFRGSATFGLGEANVTTLESAGATRDIFVAKYDLNGDLVWAKKAGGSGDDRGFGIAVDASGNSYVTGFFSGTATFDPVGNPTILESAGARDIFVAKYDSSGDLVWAKKAGGPGVDQGRGIAVDASGNSYLTSFFTGTATFGPLEANQTILESAGSLDIYVAKYNSSGELVWAKKAGGTSDDVGYGIAVDVNGNSYVTGFFPGSATFGENTPPTILTSAGDLDIYVAKYDINGNLVWVKQAGGSSGDVGVGAGIAVDANGNSYVTGFFGGSTTFGPGTILASTGASDVFVAKYNSGGILEWAKKAGGLSDDETGLGIAVDAFSNSYVTGFFSGSATFGGTTLTSAGARDIFVAKFGQCTQPPIPFAGRNWVVRQAYNEGPGPNNWSNCPQSVWVDNAGLHLKIRYDATEGKWYSAEVYTDDYTQHGIHRFNITTPADQPLLDALDKNVVLGLFLSRDYAVYSKPSEAGVPFEIDIEFAKWGTTRSENVDYVVFHHVDPLERTFKSRTMNLGGESSTSHFIDWEPSMLQFSSYKGHLPIPGSLNLLSEWNTTDGPLPVPADSIPKEEKNLRIHMNLWLIDSNPLTLGDPPSNGQEVEIIVQDIRFPDSDNDGIFDEVDTAPNTFSNDFSDGTTIGKITNRGDQTLKIADSSDPNKGVLIKADPLGGAAQATVTACGDAATYYFNAGTEYLVTCGSVTTTVLSGSVEITFIAADGTPATTSLSTGNTLTFDPTTFTFTTPATNVVPTVILVNETEFIMPPGETITIAQFEDFDAGVEIGEDEFEVEGSFTLGATSNGINPLTEDVTLEVGTFATTIPAGSFEFDDGEFAFEGVIAGVELEMKITPLVGNEFNFMVIGEGTDFTGVFNPVTVSLRIKDDAGTASVMADWYCQNNKVVICHNGNTLCINGNALPAHLNHGDYTGPCIPSGSQNLMVPGGITTTTPFEAEELEVFPNPAGNEVNIHLHGMETPTELTIYDQLGKVVWTGIMEEGQISTSISLDNSRFGNGIYFVSAITKGEKMSRRLVIVR